MVRAVRRLGGQIVRWMYRSGHREALTRELRPLVAATTGRVLDVGGGRDSPLARYWPEQAQRTRVDIQRQFGAQVQGDACRLPFASESFDHVMVSEVLEHISEPQAAIDEIDRVLKSGGQLFGSVPFLCQGIHGDPHDYFRYTDEALRGLLRAFESVRVTPHGNGLGVAWRMILTELRFLLPANPLLRQVSRRTRPMTPEGYTFLARCA